MNEEKSLDEILEEADKLAAEVEEDIGANLDPEALANMTPEELQALMGVAKIRPPQSYFTRKHVRRADRLRIRRAQRKARKITRRKGWGRTISRRKRAKKAG